MTNDANLLPLAFLLLPALGVGGIRKVAKMAKAAKWPPLAMLAESVRAGQVLALAAPPPVPAASIATEPAPRVLQRRTQP